MNETPLIHRAENRAPNHSVLPSGDIWRVSCRLPEPVWRKLERRAKRAGISPDALAALMIAAALGEFSGPVSPEVRARAFARLQQAALALDGPPEAAMSAGDLHRCKGLLTFILDRQTAANEFVRIEMFDIAQAAGYSPGDSSRYSRIVRLLTDAGIIECRRAGGRGTAGYRLGRAVIDGGGDG